MPESSDFSSDLLLCLGLDIYIRAYQFDRSYIKISALIKMP